MLKKNQVKYVRNSNKLSEHAIQLSDPKRSDNRGLEVISHIFVVKF